MGAVMTFNHLTIETKQAVGLITLNRPEALNALNAALVSELRQALDALEEDTGIGVIVVTGSEKAFAAGADIKEMKDRSFADVYLADFITKDWERLAHCRKPTLAAVAGYALGGGCEIAMMCDIVIAADNARFGQPEIKLGVIPGMGGTQRLTRAVGKAKAMDLILTGRMMDAAEAERAGLVARVVPAASLMEEALKVAETKLVPYILYGIMGYNGSGRFFLRGTESFGTTNPSKIWMEAGYWGCEIVQISGQDVASLTQRERSHLLWDGADPVQLMIRMRSGNLKTLDCFTRAVFGSSPDKPPK